MWLSTVCVLLCFLCLPIFSGLIDSKNVFESIFNLGRLGVLLSLRKAVQVFVVNVGLFYVLHSWQLDFRQIYLAFHRSLKVENTNEAYVWPFLYVWSTEDVLDVPDGAVTYVTSTTADVQVQKSAEIFPVKYKPALTKTLEKAVNAVTAVLRFLRDIEELAADVPVVNDDIIEEDGPSHFQKLTSTNDRECSAL